MNIRYRCIMCDCDIVYVFKPAIFKLTITSLDLSFMNMHLNVFRTSIFKMRVFRWRILKKIKDNFFFNFQIIHTNQIFF